MSNGIREEVESFLVSSYSHEAAMDLLASLMLFDAFEFSKPYEVFADILFDSSEGDHDAVRMNLLSAFHSLLDEIFAAHRITLSEDVDLETKNVMLGALFRLQNFENPTPILLILEGYDAPEEKLARIMEEMSQLDQARVLVAVESIDPSTLIILRDSLYKKEKAIEGQEEDLDSDVKKRLLDNLKDFFKECGEDNLAFQMIQNGIMPGHELKLYYPYVKDLIESPDENQTAKNILSFFFMGIDSFTEPMVKYRKVSEQLVHGDVTKIMRIETKMSVLLNNLIQYQKAKDDAKSISVVQHQA